MTSGRLARPFLVATTVAALVIGLAAPTASAASLSPKKWAKRFCSTVTDFREQMTQLGDEITSFIDDASSDLTTDAASVFNVIDTMADYTDDGADLASDAADAVRQLARPKVGGGGRIKSTIDDILVGGVEDLAATFETASSDFRTIADQTAEPLIATVQFTAVAGELSTTLTTAFDSIGAAFNALPDDPTIDPDGILERALSKSAACADF